ncbi:RraA family protein [Roseomonas sp. GC11]|uniref:RraA family protein n=1 Tax=Roseomonas sp. GC11 TaxID=2950546 RepID=UPI00210C5372|nr:RraA family protein [Roseomonas sp. GC11]MCQ4161628.1 RraA family protein [Roseomonas sp. GC11]
MFEIHPMPVQLDPALVALLQDVETATVGHVLHSGFMDAALRAVLPEARVAGTAVTLRMPHADSTLLHHAMSLVRPGDFLVIDRAGDTRHACWGGVITNAAKLAGVAGAVIDGPATDFSEIRRCGMPMWCRGPSAITTKLLGLEGAMNVPVSVGGVSVEPGDAILADESGVIVLKPAEAGAMARRALAMQAAELELLARLRAGEALAAITGASAKIEARNAAGR